MVYEYVAEAHTNSLGEERWLIMLPSRLVKRGDLVSDEPWSRQYKVRSTIWFRLGQGRNAFVYLDARNTRGYVYREQR